MARIGDVLAVELSQMSAYIHFCSYQIHGATLLQTRIDNEPEFKNFLKVPWSLNFGIYVLEFQWA